MHYLVRLREKNVNSNYHLDNKYFAKVQHIVCQLSKQIRYIIIGTCILTYIHAYTYIFTNQTKQINHNKTPAHIQFVHTYIQVHFLKKCTYPKHCVPILPIRFEAFEPIRVDQRFHVLAYLVSTCQQVVHVRLMFEPMVVHFIFSSGC